MKNIKYSAIMAFCFFLLTASSSFAEKQTLSDWMASYYRTQDLSRFDEFWQRTVKQGALAAEPQIREITVGFLSQIFRQHPELIKERVESVNKFPDNQRDALRILLWCADNDLSRQLLKENSDEEILKISPPEIKSRSVKHSYDIDFLQGWFWATGDNNALRPVLAFIAEAEWDAKDIRLVAAATMLREVCNQDSRVKAFVEDFMKSLNLSEERRKVFLFVLSPEPGRTDQTLTPNGNNR